MTEKLQLKLLGEFRVTAGDAELPLSGKKTRALLAYLALAEGEVLTREHLATLLWAETGDERARHNLRQELSKIRRSCTDLVVAEGEQLRLTERCNTDVGEIRRLLSSPDLEDLSTAVALYSGQLLDGLVTREDGFDDWLAEERLRLRDEICAGLERLASAAATSADVEEAVSRLRQR